MVSDTNYKCTFSIINAFAEMFILGIVKLTLLTAIGNCPPVDNLTPRSLAYFSIFLQSFAKKMSIS